MSFLHNLRQKPEHHRKRFAFLASSTVTLFIFGFWSLATFGANGLAPLGGAANVAAVQAAREGNEVSPFESLRLNLSGVFGSLGENIQDLKSAAEAINLGDEYQKMKESALDAYGR